MKYISEYSDRLEKTRKRIEELESELSRLLNETAALRAAKSSKTWSPTSTLDDSKHYAQATISSRYKDKSTPVQKSHTKNEKAPHVVLINGERYIYAAGVPVLTTTADGWTQRPRYMRDTMASSQRKYALLSESIERRLLRLKPPTKPESHESNSGWGAAVVEEVGTSCKEPHTELESPGFESSCNTTLFEEDKLCSEEPLFESKPSSTSPGITLSDVGGEAGDPLEGDLARRSRLYDRLDLRDEIVFIEANTGLSYLREAAEITQHAIFDAKGCMPEWRGWLLEEDPSLVRLGRNEMTSWMGSFEYSRRSHNGYPCRRIYDALLYIPRLRNTICHPWGDELRDPGNLDMLLQHAQKVSVVLGDEKRAQKIRGIRNTLCAEVDKCLQEIRDAHDLAAQPYYIVDHKFHHLKMFERILRYEHYAGCKKVLAVAQAWQGVAD